MEQTIEFLALLTQTPLPTVLVIAGLAFIALAIVRTVGLFHLDPSGRKLAAGVGCSLVVLGLVVGLHPAPGSDPHADGLSEDVLTRSTWTFLHREGDVIALNVRLDPSGAILGVDHPNESRWEFEGGRQLVFFHRDGYPTTKFTEVKLVDNRWELSGRLLVPGHLPVVWHVLRQR